LEERREDVKVAVEPEEEDDDELPAFAVGKAYADS